MKKLVLVSIITLATSTFSTANAGGSHGAEDIPDEDFVRVEGTRLFYNINSDTCAVTLKTRRNIRRITQRDASGEIVKRWSTRKGERVRLFSDFSKFPVALSEGTIKVKTGYKDKVKFQEIGDEFRADLADCFTAEPEPDPETICPGADVITAVSNENTASFAVPVDNPGMCDFIGTFNSATINRDGESIDLETVFNNGTPSVVSSSVTLNASQAEACLAQIGCTEFFSEPESPPSMALSLPPVPTLESLELADPVVE